MTARLAVQSEQCHCRRRQRLRQRRRVVNSRPAASQRRQYRARVGAAPKPDAASSLRPMSLHLACVATAGSCIGWHAYIGVAASSRGLFSRSSKPFSAQLHRQVTRKKRRTPGIAVLCEITRSELSVASGW